MTASAGLLPALVVFDLAGTTVRDDGQVPAAFTAALAGQGVHVTAQRIADVRGSSKKDAIRHFIPNAPDHAERVGEAYAAFQRGLSGLYEAGGVTAMPGATATFAWLRDRGVRIAFNTGFDRVITTLLLEGLRWSKGIADAVVCGDDVERGRPAPDLIRKAMALAGVDDPRRVANVGDTALDLLAGDAASVRWNIAVLSGAHDRARLEAAPHTCILESVARVHTLWSSPPA